MIWKVVEGVEGIEDEWNKVRNVNTMIPYEVLKKLK
jgi:hypothetical protein